ncbi:MAG: 2,3-bisphosphoglycerate-independent phosphoglycerate mutase [Proteobacteria bacterium]|jgi:2,3-bisphosphoglycerate-independent phosphoglycerate mutase|nr:2,3-bisphosphoglycerate-independent phosphoglycerate mutase [Pseudomonadota bacterium]MDA1302409.1 2,3-bisphosphoglycerate-independent phosphoglycerate mutase [Pseudomonadota bacterium]
MADDTSRRKQLSVVWPGGARQRFLRGMVTHDLVQRGLDFDSAYAIAQAIRDHLGERLEVTTAELRDLITQELEKIYGSDLALSLRAPTGAIAGISVVYRDQEQPFSRGLLARSIEAGGVSLDRAYRLVAELEAGLRREFITRLASTEIVKRVADLLERMEGKETARRYRTMRRIRNLSRPLILYIGGATGTGKSTLALELAPLLRIHRVSATDTIRQVMRMVFTPEILPALHSSSFEPADLGDSNAAAPVGSLHDPDFSQRLIDTFDEQATRVCVGVRAVVERAVTENTNLLVEGVHLHPDLIPFPDLEGLAYQVPLFLATLDEETHRARFLHRARQSNRLAERYLENFESIRFIQDYLLQQVEANGQPLLDTSTKEPTVGQTLRAVTGILERQAPFLASVDLEQGIENGPVLLVIIDGLADRPANALDGKTPLQAADTPVFDRLAREGQCGLADAVGPGGVADTVAGTLALFGQSPLALDRGPAEAIGAGIELGPDDIALRGNLATIENMQVLDRRAGRIRIGVDELAEAIDQLPLPGDLASRVTVFVKPASEHRLAIVLRGEGLSAAILGSDPGDNCPCPVVAPRAVDSADASAAYTAGVLDIFEQEAHKVLAAHPINLDRIRNGKKPANAVITRGAGRVHRLVPLEERGVPLRFTCIGGDRAVLGLAGMMGANIVTREGMTANLDTDLDAKFAAAGKALADNDLVAVHIKGADIAGHDGQPELKARFLEKIDRALGSLLTRHTGKLRIAIAADHATLSESGQHGNDPVPVLIWGDGLTPDQVETFDESSVSTGALQRFRLQRLLGHLFRFH